MNLTTDQPHWSSWAYHQASNDSLNLDILKCCLQCSGIWWRQPKINHTFWAFFPKCRTIDTIKTEVHQLHTAENPIQIQKPTRKIILSLKFCSLFVVVSCPPASSQHHSPPYKSKTTNIMLIPKLLHTLKNILIIAAKLSPKKLFCECLHDKTKDSLWRHDNDSNLTNSSSILCCYIHSYEKYYTLNSPDWLFSVMVNSYFSREPPVPVLTSKKWNWKNPHFWFKYL